MTRSFDTIERRRFNTLTLTLLAMTLGGELVYFFVWGLWLYPGGNLVAKAAWTLTCGIAMGSVVAVAVLGLVEGRLSGRPAFAAAALLPFAILGSCAVLCARIDASFNFFGGAESQAVFIVSGVIPAALAGLLFALLHYRTV